MLQKALATALVNIAIFNSVHGKHDSFDPSQFTGELRGQDYEGLSRQEKQAVIWHRITEDLTSGPWNAEELLTLNLWEVFADYGDEIPCLPNNCRIKSTTNVGMHAKVKLVRNKKNKQYKVGMLKGADSGIMRISPRFEPMVGGNNNAWGSVAIKLLRNGELSANILTQASIAESSNTNLMGQIYETVVTTQSPAPKDFCGLPSLELVSQVSDYGVSQSIVPLFEYTENGRDEEEYDFPFRLILVPRDFSSFPSDSLDPPFTEYMTTIPSGTTLFDVYASEELFQDVSGLDPIATIVSDSEFVTSKWGDESLFFRHYRFEEQLALEPEHGNKGNYFGVYETPDLVKNIVASFPTTQCPFTALYQSLGFPMAP